MFVSRVYCMRHELLAVYDFAYVGSSHWYLAIICFPYLVGEKLMTSTPESATAAAKPQPRQVFTCVVHCINVMCLRYTYAYLYMSATVDVCGLCPVLDAQYIAVDGLCKYDNKDSIVTPSSFASLIPRTILLYLYGAGLPRLSWKKGH